MTNANNNDRLIRNDEKNDTQNNLDVIEAAGAMDDFRNVLNKDNDVDLDTLINIMNDDQKRVFQHVIKQLKDPNAILKYFVFDIEGTGKSFIIQVLKKWIEETMQKEVEICAPTGIAAFDINGLIVHRLIQ